MNGPGPEKSWETDLVSFGFHMGSYTSVVKRVGCGRGFKKFTHFLLFLCCSQE